MIKEYYLRGKIITIPCLKLENISSLEKKYIVSLKKSYEYTKNAVIFIYGLKTVNLPRIRERGL